MSDLGEQLHNTFEPKGLKATINSLRGRFFTLEEFPFIERDILPLNVLREAMKLPKSDIEGYAVSLKGKELEGLILDLRNAADSDEIQRASEILTIRISPRILKLLTILYQYNFMSAGLNFVLKEIAQKTEEKNDTSQEAAFVRRFGSVKNKIAASCAAINEYKMDIDESFRAFSISNQSPFAEEVVIAYLGNTSKEGLMNNRKWIINAIEHHTEDRLHELIANYLSSFSIVEFNDEINLAIMHKIGQPYISPDWEFYNTELRDKFAQWCYLYQLKLHSSEFPKKFIVLRKYYNQVRSSYEIKEENLLVIDFGDIVIADISTNSYSSFYEKSAFEEEMVKWKMSKENEAAWSLETGEEKPKPYLPSFILLDKKNLTARDFIIEEIEEPCVKLSYEGIDVLYINEMLDIKIGLEPDMRTKQLAKIRKRVKKKAL